MYYFLNLQTPPLWFQVPVPVGRLQLISMSILIVYARYHCVYYLLVILCHSRDNMVMREDLFKRAVTRYSCITDVIIICSSNQNTYYFENTLSLSVSSLRLETELFFTLHGALLSPVRDLCSWNLSMNSSQQVILCLFTVC